MVSARRWKSEWAAKGADGQAGRQVDRQGAKGIRRGGLASEEGTRAQPPPPLGYIPRPAGVRENTPSVSSGGKWLFLKNSFL